MCVILVRQAHLAPATDLCDGVDVFLRFMLNGLQDVLETENLCGRQVEVVSHASSVIHCC